jgi:hypothetical protein
VPAQKCETTNLKRNLIALPIAMLLTLAGCHKFEAASNTADGDGGHYAGIGTYPSDPLWKHIEGTPSQKDKQAARLEDDSQVIVVLDRQTGEVRQCGNKSGYCVTMNPWASDKVVSSPVRLSKHASELSAQDAAIANAADTAQ